MTSFDTDEQFATYDDNDHDGDGLVRIQWRQGSVQQGTGGYFFLSKKNVPDGFAPAGDVWMPHQEYFKESRTRDDGWKAEALPMYIICARAQPFRKGIDSKNKTWLEAWPKGAEPNTIAQHADVLLVADGLQELGPVCWSTNSTTTAFAVISGADPKRSPKGGILHRIREEVLGAADMASKTLKERRKKKLYWLFWITITTQRDAKGQIVYTPTKSGTDVTLPVPLLPDTIDAAWLSAAFVGAEIAVYGRDIRAQYESWRATKFTNDAVPAALPAGRNVPQPVTDADFEPAF